MDEKITVIVPVYNVEHYLDKCLDSLINQTYKNLEIIVINDGSTDNSGTICQEYAQKDDRIIYIEKENGGQSEARNMGLDRMTGSYVTFVDSDDWVELDYVEVLYNKLIEYQADIVVGNYCKFNESDLNFYFHISENYFEKVYDNVSIVDCLNDSNKLLNSTLIVAWGKIYRKEIISNFRFPVGRVTEDTIFNLRVLLASKSIVYINKAYYIYRVRSGSISNSWDEKWVRDCIYAIEDRLALLSTLGYPMSEHIHAYKSILNHITFESKNRGISDSHVLDQIKEKKMLLDLLQTQNQEFKKAIVLAANHAYVEQVVTTIKSICYHNRSIRFYLINSDFPNEWFKQLNKRLEVYDSEIINCRVTSEQISRYKTDISYTVFLRYFVSDFVQEDKALYLDCDLVVTKNLDNLFETDLQEYSLAAVRDYGGRVYYGREMFNAGVLLINNRLWKQENMSQRLIDLTNEWHDKVDQADQSILNMLFENRWIEMEFDNNHVVIHKQFTDYELPAGQDYPGIIHYLSHRKPWFDLAAQTYRDVWWYYHSLEWTELGKNHHLHPLQKSHIYPIREPLTCLIYTSSDQIEQIDTLIQSLPNIQFKIAARVMVSDRLKQLLVYPNVTVYAGINYLVELDQELIETSQVLLDINHGEKTEEMLDQFAEKGKLILAFENTKYREVGQITYKVEQVQEMIEKLREVEEKHGF